MTERLYYTEPALVAFEARVLACDTREGRTEVRLDRTAFYPTSGGQPFDTGRLNDVRVVDVQDGDDGSIVHVVERPIEPGAMVSGRVDWPRRFDHMQQHTGQHVLSAAYDRLFGVRTESFHLSAVSSTIDLAREVSAREIQAAEDEANRIVWADRPVTIRFVSAEEAAALPLRKDPARPGPLRVIDVEEFDLSACGGTHVARTGAIGIIATSRWEKMRGGTRVEFVCGGRALARFREWRDILATAMRTLSVTAGDLPSAIERLQGDLKTVQRAARMLQEQLAGHEARILLARAETIPDRLIVVEAIDGWDAAGLKALAVAATRAEPRAAVALFSRHAPSLVVVARGTSLTLEASAVVKSLHERYGGRGGGKPELAQGGGFDATESDLLAAAREALRH
jgi:alanyl-tRNA synthetase